MTSRFQWLYQTLAVLAAVFICLTLLVELAIIIGRFADFQIDGGDAYAGYFMAAGSFLALAATLRQGDHIRVTLILQRLTGKARVWVEIFCLLVATLLTAYFTWYSGKLVYGSYIYHDISQNTDATPLWIPQLSMVIGLFGLFVAFAEELVYVVRTRRLAREDSDEMARTE
ncbi:TRAP-type C4-dicarboxylate transport system permease small subunit [Cupriavidus gilardii J11]|uniref:TRAP transporter small permease protein n=1 Tax=Cupriavidus gilardii J11 TaxID=936133 RepID=A0A562B5X3_9BURK|nr:TRAP transporter small permease [Cupriavidus gilardii]TWG80503.1 TRAP-type C4-dicarboxylate transport system permease small subunit [Cupriavidus gilardii J11]